MKLLQDWTGKGDSMNFKTVPLIGVLFLTVLLSIHLCSCTGSDDHAGNEFVKCYFDPESPRRHILRTNDIPFTVECRSAKGPVELRYISVSMIYTEETRKRVTYNYFAEKYKYSSRKHDYGSYVSSVTTKTLSREVVMNQPVIITPGSPWKFTGVMKYKPLFKTYYKGRSIALGGEIRYPKGPYSGPSAAGTVTTGWTRYHLWITEDVD